MTARVRLGLLTPSSNTALEPIAQAMLAGIPEVSVHFGRFPVTEIALDARALAQFDDDRILQAAELLAHAHVDVIVWNGTSSAWLGWEADERLCRRISEATGIVATTSMLALNEILLKRRQRRLGLITPYTYDVQARITANYEMIGITCVVERHFGIADNFCFAEIPQAALFAAARDVALTRPDAIAFVCTNLRAAPLIESLEAELDLPIYDTIAAANWKSLVLAGIDPARVTGWGRLFAGSPA